MTNLDRVSQLPTPPESPENNAQAAAQPPLAPTNTPHPPPQTQSPETPPSLERKKEQAQGSARQVRSRGRPTSPPPSSPPQQHDVAKDDDDDDEDDEDVEVILRDPRDLPSHRNGVRLHPGASRMDPLPHGSASAPLRRSKTASHRWRARAAHRHSQVYDADTESDDHGDGLRQRRRRPVRGRADDGDDDPGKGRAPMPLPVPAPKSQGQAAGVVAGGRRGSVGKAALRVKLDLNLHVEIMLKAKIHGDVILSVL